MRAILFGAPRETAADWDGVAEAIRSGAAFLAQGSIYSYLRARSGTQGPRLFQDAGFGAALDLCKWEGFAVAAQDLVLILEADLRGPGGVPTAPLAGPLGALYDAALSREPVPAHRAAEGWADLSAEFRARLGFALAGPPRRTDEIATATARRLLRHAPVEDAIRLSDAEMVTNNVAFRFIDYKRRLRREIDLPALAGILAAQAGAAQ